jgi:hypothetical protein
MKRLGVLLGLTTILIASVSPGTAAADGGYAARYPHRFEEPSVFPKPRDPWKNWGVRDRHLQHPGAPSTVAVPPSARWVPGYWQWNGYQWLWIPGYWVW